MPGQGRRRSRSRDHADVTGARARSLLHVFLILLLSCPGQCRMVTCNLTRERGPQAATVTCTLSDDLQGYKGSMVVQRFSAVGKLVKKPVATCKVDAGFNCTVWDNDTAVMYHNSGQQTDQLTLLIPSPPADRYYVCHLTHSYAIPLACTLERGDIPSQPEVEVTQTTSTTIEFRWHCESDGGNPLLGYEVSITSAEGDSRSIRVPPENTTFIARELQCGTRYNLTVQALNSEGSSPESSVIDVRTNGSVPVLSSGAKLVKDVNPTSVTIDLRGWETSGCPILFFSVWYSRLGNASYTRLSNISSDNGAVTVENLEPFSSYNLTVTAHSQAGDVLHQVVFTTLPAQAPKPETTTDKGQAVDGKGQDQGEGTHNSMVVVEVVVIVMGLALIGVVLGILYRRLRRRRMQSERRNSVPFDNLL